MPRILKSALTKS